MFAAVAILPGKVGGESMV